MICKSSFGNNGAQHRKPVKIFPPKNEINKSLKDSVMELRFSFQRKIEQIYENIGSEEQPKTMQKITQRCKGTHPFARADEHRRLCL